MDIMRRLSCCVLVTLALLCDMRDAVAQEQDSKTTTLRLGPAEIQIRDPWAKSPIPYTGAIELVARTEVRVHPKADGQDPQTQPGHVIEILLARLLITVEPRLSYEEALRRLDEIAASRPEPAHVFAIGEWPAVELEFKEPLAQRGQGPYGSNAIITRSRTAIAVGDRVVNFDISLMPNSPPEVLRDGQALARETSLPTNPDPAAAQREIERIKSKESMRKTQQIPEKRSMAPQNAPALVTASEPQESTQARSGASALVLSGRGELEIAASRNANTIVIATNAGISFSRNRGGSFTASNPGIFNPNDPSVVRGASDDFYLAGIAFPNNLPAQLGVSGCTNAISRSTDNGSTFSLQGYSATCPATGSGMCFPDQEHLSADTSTTGNDQIYAVWRNMVPVPPLPAGCRAITAAPPPTSTISCSQDNGVNWTAPAPIAGAGDYPRGAVASDGTVYVITIDGSNNLLLNRFSSCAARLAPAAGFPVTVATLNGNVACPVPGLDRCNNGNALASPTVAPDPGNAASVFVTYAESDGTGGERVVMRQSADNGLTFGAATTVSGNSSARRFMPWSCSTRSTAWIGWYDRSAATAPGASNDLTDYVVGAANGTPQTISQQPDPQCASGWPVPPRSPNDATSCPTPQLAGSCQLTGGGGSGNRCDFNNPVCPTTLGGAETCQPGNGSPKYGDYNGIACAGDYVIAAWASATAPPGRPAPAGISVYSSVLKIDAQGNQLAPTNPVADFLPPIVEYLLRKEPPDMTAVHYILLGP